MRVCTTAARCTGFTSRSRCRRCECRLGTRRIGFRSFFSLINHLQMLTQRQRSYGQHLEPKQSKITQVRLKRKQQRLIGSESV